MANLNVVVIEGHLVKAAELAYFQDGTPYCNFSVACNESYKKMNGDQVEYVNVPSYFDCNLVGKYGESMAKYLQKGRAIRVMGKLKQSRWEKDGQKFSRVYVKAQEIFLSPIQNNNNYQQDNSSYNYQNPQMQNNKQMPAQVQAVQNVFNGDVQQEFNDEPDFVPFTMNEDIPF